MVIFYILPSLTDKLPRLLLGISASMVIISSLLAFLFAIGEYLSIIILAIPEMVVFHGSLNIGFIFIGFLAWLVRFHRLEFRTSLSGNYK